MLTKDVGVDFDMVKESIGRIFNFDNNFISKMAAAWPPNHIHILAHKLETAEFSLDYHVFKDSCCGKLAA